MSHQVVISDCGTEVKFHGPEGSKAEVTRVWHYRLRKWSKGCLEWIHVPPEARGGGVGLALMASIVKYADQQRLDLHLEAIACADEGKGPDQVKLERWYEKHGFKRTRRKGERGGTIMVRLWRDGALV